MCNLDARAEAKNGVAIVKKYHIKKISQLFKKNITSGTTSWHKWRAEKKTEWQLSKKYHNCCSKKISQVAQHVAQVEVSIRGQVPIPVAWMYLI
jgi:hypothetical protein